MTALPTARSRLAKQLGNIYLAIGNLEGAILSAQHEAALHPENAFVVSELGEHRGIVVMMAVRIKARLVAAQKAVR